MSRWFRLYDEILDDPKVQKLPPDEFKAEFYKAVRGEDSALSDWVVPDYGRLPWLEWSVIRLAIFERDDYTCQYCGKHGVKLECDHVIPLCKGGSNDKKNLVTACRECNRKKSHKTLEEWQAPKDV